MLFDALQKRPNAPQTALGALYRRLIIATLSVTPLFGSEAAAAKDTIRPISAAETVSIARAAVKGTKLDDDLEPMGSSLEPGFNDIQIFTTHPGTNGTIGYVAVNMWTGDVWDVTFCKGHSSKRMTSDEAGKLQDSIRRRHGLSVGAYRRLADKRPLCLFP